MNKLYVLKELGFRVSWKLLAIGLYGMDEIPPSITRTDITDYLEDSLTEINGQTDNTVALICEKDAPEKFDKLLKKLAREDAADSVIQKRKWRVCLLKNVIDNINGDALQGLLELMEFWVSMRRPEDCPMAFPNSNNKKAVQKFYTQASYDLNLSRNREWLNEEISKIIKAES